MASPTFVPPPQRRRVLRWLRNLILLLVALVAVCAIAGAAYQAIETRADARRFPQQGKSVDVGGYQLNLNCTGEGSPTVILESGLGVPAIGWNKVQPEIAKFARVCSYDRAGYGWSDAGPLPRTSAQIVKELHALLQNSGEKPPYVLVGHSFGGFNIRVYNAQFPDEVVGMVLVDASHEEQNNLLPPALKKVSITDQKAKIKTQLLIGPILNGLGVTRFMTRNQAPPPGVSKNFAQEYIYLSLPSKFLQATAGELESFDESADQVRAAGTLGDKPLVVLTAGKDLDEKSLPKGLSKKDFDEFRPIWINDLQMREARLSTRGKRILVADSSHMIPFERPDTIVTAVRDVCSAVNSIQVREHLFPVR